MLNVEAIFSNLKHLSALESKVKNFKTLFIYEYHKVMDCDLWPKEVYCSQLYGTWISEECCHGGTGKRIQDRSIISSIKPKFDDQFFVDLRVLYKLGSWNCSTSSTNQINNNFMFTTCTKHVNQQRIIGQILN